MKAIYVTKEQRKKLNGLLLENEGTNMKRARKYLESKGYSPEQRQQTLDYIRTDIPNSRLQQCKFLLGVTRLYIEGQLNYGNAIANLNKTLKYIASDAHVNEYDYNLNGENVDTLVQRFASAAKSDLEQSKNASNERQLTVNNNYKIVPINYFKESSKYKKYFPNNDKQRWCVTHDENMYNSYTNNGSGRFYFCLRKGFENEPRVEGEGCPLDSYGLSMIAVSVTKEGEVNTITCRWNHDNGGNDNIMTIEQLEDVIGRNFYQTFKPYTSEETFDWCFGFKEGFAIVRLNNKYNFINIERKLLSSQWFDWCDDFRTYDDSGKLFVTVELNKNLFKIDGEGRLYDFHRNPVSESKKNRKTIYITEAQKKKIKKAIAAQDQVGGKVNAGVMDAVAYCGGMCEEKEPIQEAAVDLEYHYTSLRNLISMMRTDTFNLSDNTDKFLKEPGRKGDYFMSLTRMRNSAEGYGKGIINSDESPVIRIELDGRKLNMIRNVNIHPYDYFYNNWDGGLGMTHVVRGRSGGDSYTAEAEDSLTLKNGKDQIVDASEYINRIDIFLKDYVNSIKSWDAFLNAIKKFPDWGDKMHFFINPMDFNYQRNEIPKSKIYSMYNEQAKQALGENVEDDTYKLGAEKGQISPYYHVVNESMEDVCNVMEDYDLNDYKLLDEFRRDRQNGIKVKKWNLIPAQQYHTLLKRYMTSPEMARIPYNVVNDWFVSIIIPNACDIEFITNFAGHSSYFDAESVCDIFGVDVHDYSDGWKYLESIGFYDWCVLPDGSDAWSDYGLKPLFEIISEYSPNLSAEEILILINRCLDVVHQRGDLASAFIEGGSRSCDYISNSVNENTELETKWNGEGYEFKLEKAKNVPTVLYHASLRKNRESILANGILAGVGEEYRDWWNYEGPNGEIPDDEELPDAVFLSYKPYTWSDTFPTDFMDIYRVDTNMLDKNLFYVDPDKYLALEGCFCYMGNIPNKAFRLIDCVRNGKSFNINENVNAEIVNPDDIDLSSFNIKKQLNPEFWIDGKLDSEIRIKLLDIADDFIDFLGIDFGQPDDIIMTGSLANYNWDGKYSDIDLHILVDYEDFGDNYALVDEYFYSKKSLWNEQHKDIKIHGFPVELFVQDIHEKHCSSGVYSLEKDRWVVEPSKETLTSSKVNKNFIREKISDYMNKIDKFEYIYKKVKNDSYKSEKLYNKVDALFDKIKKDRKVGFEKSGGKEINNFNIIFKALRRNGYIEKLVSLKTNIYDSLKSLN